MVLMSALVPRGALVYAGKLHPRISVGLAPLMHLQLRVLEKTEVEKRVAKVERLLRDLMAGN
jgi:hypothetical protein